MRRALAAAVALTLVSGVAAAQDSSDRILALKSRIVPLVTTIRDLNGDLSQTVQQRRVTVTLAADVLFDFNRADLTPKASAVIRRAARIVEKRANPPVRVVGFTDAKGAPGYNLRLSRRRAQTVHDALVRQLGQTARSYEVAGRGERDPVARNTTPDGADNPRGRALNRRVEISFAR